MRVAQEMALFGGLQSTYEVDSVTRSVMKEDMNRQVAEAASRKGGWADTHHGGEYRKPGHADVNPDTVKGKGAIKRLYKKTRIVLERQGMVGISAGVQKRAPRQTAGVQKRAPRQTACVVSCSGTVKVTTKSLQQLVKRAISVP